MADTRRLACVQTDPVFGEVAANLDAAEALIASLRADLVVLPELFATGYAFRDRAEALALAEAVPEGPTSQRLVRWSARTGGVFVGGVAERAGDTCYNAAVVAAAGRYLGTYRKMHLFGFESEVFAPGQEELEVLEHQGLRIGVMVCFDWIYPEVARVLALEGADVIAHPANLVLPWCQQAMPVRALENGVFTATANRVGCEARPPRPRLTFTGQSLLAAPGGEVLAKAPQEDAAVIAADVDLGRARDKRLPSGDDRFGGRRPSHYGRLLLP